MKIINRLKAAVAAFKDPRLVSEAEGMRNTMIYMDRYEGIALLRCEPVGDYLHPEITLVSYSQVDEIKRIAGIY